MLNFLSILSFLVMIGGITGLVFTEGLFSDNPLVIAVQFAAVSLMVWARITFGGRSFHATANPTDGGLVTTGPYHFIRHPIYTAVCLFAIAGVCAHPSLISLGFFLTILCGAIGRMLAEEHLLIKRYPDYQDYAKKTKRMVPYLF